jgi:hypothetical protein
MTMESEKNKKDTLFEDLQMGSNNYLGVGKGPGQSAMTHKPGKVTLLDLLSQAKEWDDEMEKAPNRLPFPLQDGLSEQLGELFIANSEIQNKVAQSAKNVIIRDNKKALKQVKKIHKKLTVIGDAIKSVVRDLDELGVGTSTPGFHE